MIVRFIPFILILQFPIHVQGFYFVLSLWLAILGRNRKGGFWCYLFSSILLSPVVGFMMLLVSGKKTG